MAIDSSINLRNDLIFKFVFGYEKNERILIALLNAILGYGNDSCRKQPQGKKVLCCL
jgi:hypothetical protein